MRTFLYQLLRVYWKVARPLTLGARTIVVRDGRVLLVRLTYVKGWCFPGGGVDRGESFYDGAIRELREECGLEADDAKLLGVYLNPKRGNIDHVALYVVERFREIPNAQRDPEVAEMKWFDLHSLPDGTTSSTRRRINEYLGEEPIRPEW